MSWASVWCWKSGMSSPKDCELRESDSAARGLPWRRPWVAGRVGLSMLARNPGFVLGHPSAVAQGTRTDMPLPATAQWRTIGRFGEPGACGKLRLLPQSRFDPVPAVRQAFVPSSWLELKLAYELVDACLVSALRHAESKGADGVQVGRCGARKIWRG
jgi:hypothetical protein